MLNSIFDSGAHACHPQSTTDCSPPSGSPRRMLSTYIVQDRLPCISISDATEFDLTKAFETCVNGAAPMSMEGL
jgi:hypothetical protein